MACLSNTTVADRESSQERISHACTCNIQFKFVLNACEASIVLLNPLSHSLTVFAGDDDKTNDSAADGERF